MPDYAAARFHMVEGQLRPNKVSDPRVTEAVMAIPREVFVPKAMRGIAYVDAGVTIAPGRQLLEPMVFGRMLQEAAIRPSDVVLDIGSATGYSTAVIARLAATVVGVESDPEMVARSSATLSDLGVDNALIVQAPLAEGYPAQGPYDVIVINGAVEELPPAIGAQLADGGRMVTTVVNRDGIGEVRLFQRNADALSSRVLFEAKPAILPGFAAKPVFQF